MAVLKNRAKMSTSTTGTGTITLGSAEDGYQTFADAGVANADVVRYVIEDGSNWEIGTGTYTASGTTLSRTVSESSNSDAAINLSGSAIVFIGATAEDIPALYAANPSSATDPTASGANDVAIGSNASATGSRSVSIGYSSASNGVRGLAIGYSAFSDGTYASAIGRSYASGSDSFAAAIGSNSSSLGATGSYSIAIGRQANASATNAVAIGLDAVSSNTESTAVGSGAIASGNSSFAGSNSRVTGSDSVAFGVTFNSTSYGALSHKCFVVGYGAKATNMFSTAIGPSARAEGTYATTIGDNAKILGGNYNSAFGAYSEITSNASSALVLGHKAKSAQQYATAIGYEAYSDVIGKYAFASGKFSAYGDALGGQFILRADTTDATATVLTTNNSTAAATNQIVAASDTCITFDGTITAMQNGAQAYASWRIEGLLVNDGGTTTLANSATTVIQNASSWGMALSADNTNNALAITCTGEASHNIRWVANIRTSEVTYA